MTEHKGACAPFEKGTHSSSIPKTIFFCRPSLFVDAQNLWIFRLGRLQVASPWENRKGAPPPGKTYLTKAIYGINITIAINSIILITTKVQAVS
jgi:hypothetical protein